MRLRLMNDYSVAIPLWGDNYEVDFLPPGVPADLEADLRAWAKQFNDNFEPGTGWPTRDMADSHRAEGERLLRQLRAALPNDEVVLDYWELMHR